jgi:YggT family protein
MLAPFVTLLINIVDLYMLCVIVWAILYTLISFKIVNASQTLVRKIMYALDKLCEPVLSRIRKYMPDLGGIDLSPIVLLLALVFLKDVLRTYFY